LDKGKTQTYFRQIKIRKIITIICSIDEKRLVVLLAGFDKNKGTIKETQASNRNCSFNNKTTGFIVVNVSVEEH
jgi:hypothetical protein